MVLPDSPGSVPGVAYFQGGSQAGRQESSSQPAGSSSDTVGLFSPLKGTSKVFKKVVYAGVKAG